MNHHYPLEDLVGKTYIFVGYTLVYAKVDHALGSANTVILHTDSQNPHLVVPTRAIRRSLKRSFSEENRIWDMLTAHWSQDTHNKNAKYVEVLTGNSLGYMHAEVVRSNIKNKFLLPLEEFPQKLNLENPLHRQILRCFEMRKKVG